MGIVFKEEIEDQFKTADPDIRLGAPQHGYLQLYHPVAATQVDGADLEPMTVVEVPGNAVESFVGKGFQILVP